MGQKGKQYDEITSVSDTQNSFLLKSTETAHMVPGAGIVLQQSVKAQTMGKI